MFSYLDWFFISLIFIWTGFVRTGLGLGGAALGLPLMLLVGQSPVFWLPIIGLHLFFFSGLTLKTALDKVDWSYLKYSLWWILPPTLVGVFGLISLPPHLLTITVYGITLGYALMWLFGGYIHSQSTWVDKLLFILGGYVSGLSLTGAPIIVSVYMRHIAKECLRNTLFVLWFILVSIKMSTFVAFGIEIHWKIALMMLPIAYIGHWLGLKAHQQILHNQARFIRIVGFGLAVISSIGLIKIL